MTTAQRDHRRRHPAPFREDNHTMFHIEFRLAEAEERMERFRSEAARGRPGFLPERPIRRRLGRSLVRLGRRVAGDALTTPAWQG